MEWELEAFPHSGLALGAFLATETQVFRELAFPLSLSSMKWVVGGGGTQGKGWRLVSCGSWEAGEGRLSSGNSGRTWGRAQDGPPVPLGAGALLAQPS